MSKTNSTLIGGFKVIQILSKFMKGDFSADGKELSLEEVKTRINAAGKAEKVIENQVQIAKLTGRKLNNKLWDYIFEPVE